MIDKPYLRWTRDDVVERYAHKTIDQYFESETHFLRKIMSNVSRVLDIGCASGRYYELLKQFNPSVNYTGLDVSEKSILSARSLHPACTFILANAVGYRPDAPYDLVNATGVVQHEAHCEELICAMVGMSQRYVLFDVKLSVMGKSCCDISQAFSGVGDAIVPFNVCDLGWLVRYLQQFPRMKKISMFGYRTSINAVTTVPSDIKRVFSAGVLCELASAEVESGADIEIVLQ
jgi:SAM-dependent methyltransferase